MINYTLPMMEIVLLSIHKGKAVMKS